MREIKFRVWSGKQKQMFYLAEQYLDRYFMEIDNHSWGVFDKETYKDSSAICNKHYKGDVCMQYTGLKDRNGKEIFEGDILGGIIGCPVVWVEKEARFGFDCAGELNATRFEEWEQDDLEVIGNIYDNPELLEGDKHDTKA